MRNIYALFIAIGIIISSIADAFAAHVDSTRVMQSALGFFSALTHTPTERLLSEGVSIAYRACAAETAGSHAGAVCFYVINVGQKGFVMLSGDDRITPVLGYSYESSFNTKNMPENLRNWLEARRKEISSALGSGTLFPSPGIIQQWNHLPEIGATMSVVVQPLLQTTWDQNAYYNQYCPEDMIGPNGHAYAGCVATAMAQIIRYWEWPASGFDSHSYTCAYGTQSVDFSTANYNYSDMPNSIQGSSSLTQIDAVAMLTYHCGVSVDMDYGPDGSGAYSAYVPYALFHYFAYPPGMSYQSKSSYSSSEWNNLLRNELNNGRPILYSGGEGSGGHSFICDGYDNNGTYHFNWGWSGNFNGYFALNALTPGPFDFSDGQTAAIGISADGSFLRCSQNGLNVSAPIGGYSEVKTVDVRGHSLNGNITVTAGNGFVVGADGNTFSNSVTIPAQGGRLYVKYTPTLTFPGTQNANVVLASGSVRDTVFCYGTAVEEVCLPPRDLTGTHTGNQVHLSWSEPVEYVSGSPASVTLSWDSTVMGVSASIGSDLTLCMMQRFDVNDLAPYHHYLLNSISFIPSAQGTSFRLVAFKGGNYSNGYYPGTQVVNQEIPAASLVRGTWNTVQLNSPVLVDVTEELWFGFVVYTTGNNGNVICLSTGNHVPGKGNVFGVINGYNDGTGNFYWEPVTLSYNFPIKGMLEQISADVVRYDVYRNASQIGSSTSTSYIDNSPSASNCEYTVTAVWDNNCTQSAFVMVNQPVVSLPTVTTGDVSNITTSSATCVGDVTSAGGSTVTARGICWSTSQNPTVDGSHSTDNGNDLGTFTSNITGLTPNTTYYVRAYATNNAGTAYGVQKSFKTSCNSVTVSIMGNSTVSYGQSTTLTASGASTYHWSTNENTASITVSPTSTTTYTVTGTNSYGCTATASKTVTVNADLPTVTTIEVFNITTLTAVCSCEVSSDGGSTVTVRGVCWSTSPIPTINDSHTADSSGTGSFASFISGLTPNTAYYVRAYAMSNMGTAYGEVLSFTTAEVSSDGQPCPNYPTVTDIDGNVYNTVQIGDQCWTRENLRTTRYANGTEIALGSGISETTAYRYYPNNNSDNVATYGYLYNWAAVMHGAPSTDSIPSGVQGLCPAGWHVPSIWEWSQLTFFIRSQDQYFCSNNSLYFAKSLASITGWNASSAECGVGNDPGTNNATNFSVLAAGYYYGDASDFGNYTYLWSTSESEDNNIYSYGFCNDQAFAAVISNTYKTLGLSVRCLLDEGNTSSLPTVITHQVATVTSNSATCGGNVTDDSGAAVTARGVCWSTSPNPTISDNHTSDGSGLGLFTSNITGLMPNTMYYVRAYATNSVGTTYGEQRMFTTSCTNFLIADTVAVCGNYTWNGETYTESGDYVQIFQTAYGCDSVVTLHLTVYHSWTCDTTCVACDSFTWHGVMYTETPVVAPIHTYQTAHGCDSVVTLHLHIIHSKTVTLDSVVCANEVPITWNGLTFTEAGTQTLALVSAEGCDSVVVMTLQVNGCGPVVDEKSCPAAPTVTDHEGNVYATVQIGSQCWMRDNLRTTTSPTTGTYLIPPAGTTYTYTGKQARWYNDDSTTYAPMNYGLLYNWNAAVDTFNTAYGETSVNTGGNNAVSVSFTGHRRGICPEGWHLPSDAEWTQLTDYVNSQSNYVCDSENHKIAKALASTTDWASSTYTCTVGNTPDSNNATDFCALPAGAYVGSSYNGFGTRAYFWSSTEYSVSDAYFRYLDYNYAYIGNFNIYKCYGFSVRCLRDKTDTAVIDSKSCPAAPTVTDHEGNVYATVQIGNQCWMRDNLRTSTSPSTGTYLIPAAGTTYTYTGKQARWYNNDSTTYAPMNYGLLYNWNAAVDTFNTAYGETSVNTSSSNVVSVSFTGHRRGICPVGWHLPSDGEWTEMTDYVSSQSEYVCGDTNINIAKALASTEGWSSNTSACAVGNTLESNNKTGFSALPSGGFDGSSFGSFGTNASFWSSTENGWLDAYYRALGCDASFVYRDDDDKSISNCSVRCLRDEMSSATVIDSRSCPAAPTVTDHEGNVYATVQIGNQCWMRDNLRTTTSPSTGTKLIRTAHSGYNTFTGKQARWYNNDSTMYAPRNYGLLYNWNAAVDTFNTSYTETSVDNNSNHAVSVVFVGHRRGVCPEGWHLPSDSEWTMMTDYVSSQGEYTCGGDSSNIAKSIADSVGWATADWGVQDYLTPCSVGNNPTSNNTSGFSALPAGTWEDHYDDFSVFSLGYLTNYWSSTESANSTSWTRGIGYDYEGVGRINFNKCKGYSVRCLRDSVGCSTSQTQPTVTTEVATDITASSATLHGTVTNPDNVTITEQGFEWKTTQGGTYSVVNASGATMSYNLTGLAANTSYTYRAFAATAEGTSYGEEVSFTTPCASINVSFSATACGSYTWNGGVYTESGTYTQTFTVANGCDSVVTLDLTIHNPTIDFLVNDVQYSHDVLTFVYCRNKEIKVGVVPDGWEYVWWWNDYTAGCETCNPVYYFTLNTTEANYSFVVNAIDTNGCQAFGMINVLTMPLTATIYDTVICQNDLPFVWNGKLVTEAGTYYDTLTAMNGCDSVVTLNIVVNSCIPADDGQPCPSTPAVTDHEGNVYATVQLGNQCWMRDNLRTTTSPSTGTYLIPAAGTGYTYTGKQAFWYNNDSVTYATMNYGLLYNWNAAVDTFNTAYGETSVNTSINNAVSVSFNGNRRGICPVGWHLPSDAEWTTLTDYVSSQPQYTCGGETNHIAKALADSIGWNTSTNTCAVGNDQSSNNATGFGALSAGSCSNSSFYFANNATYFWSSSEYNNLTALYRSIVNYAANVASSKNLKNCGFSVRCLRDSVGGSTSQTQPTVTTEEATDITSSSATLNGTVANPDNVTITAQGFQWKASQGGTYSVVNASGATMSYNLTGLAANTSYTYRAFATTEEGTSYGEEMNFTTHCPTIKITGPSCSFIFGNITLVASGADNYIWSTGDSSATITVAQSNTTTYSVTGTDSYGCVGTDSMLVAVYPSFNPTEVGTGLSDIEVNCNNSTVTLCANVVVNSTKDYIVESIPYNPPFGFAEGTRIFNAGDEDSWGASIHLPFNFSFYGLCYSNVYPGSNSVLTFNYPPQQCNWHYTDSIPNTNLFANTIFACYRDLDIGNLGIDGGVFDTVYGEFPNRCFKLSFNNVGLYSDNSLSNTFSSMIILHEGTNIIDIYLRDAPTIVSWNNGNGVLGLQNRTGDKGITPPGRNTGPWTAHEEAWRFIPVADSNYTVTWYLGNTALSTGIIVGTGDTITVSPQESTDYTARLQYTDDCGNEFFLFQTCHVTVNKEGPIVTVNASQNELCEGDNTTLSATGADTYLWSTGNATDSITVSPTSTTTYYVTGYTGQTCSSVDSITVIVWESFDTLFNITVCDSYTWNDSVYTSSGDYVQHFQTIHGCDSVVTLHLTVNHSDATDMYATSCDSYTWNGVTYHESGDYFFYLTNAVGCDSIVTMHLTINYSDTIEFSATACNNYNWNGITYTESGDYVANMTNASGCDLVVVLHLTVNHSDTTDLYASACDSYSWNGATYYASGDYVHTFTNVAGCDSVVTLHLTINHSVHSDLFVSDCESYTWDGTTYTLSGDHVQTFTSVNGCDSVVTMHLVLNNTDALVCDTTVCDIFTWNDMTYSASGDYVQTFINKNGCDSVVTLHLTVNHSCSTILQATACDSYTWNGVTYTESGDYPLYLTNAVGCDSIVTLHLTINYSDTIEFSATACNSYNWNGVTYTESGDYTTYMTNASGCNLLLVLHLTVNHSDTTNLYASACDSYFWNGTTYYASGDYVHIFTNAAGCDSVVTLHLTISETDHTNLTEEACDSYTWNGEIYTESGIYTQTLTNVNGCDSVVTLHLTVSNTSHTDITEEVCDSYTWNGEVYTESGLYTETFTNINGCDSVVTLHLTVNHSDTIDFYATACDSYNWNDETYTESGDYTHLMTSSTGCNLVAMLHLTINYSEITEFDISTEDSCYVWNGTTYCSSGDYIQTMQTEDGCDSLIILHLTITVGIDDHELTSSMILYPNPTDNIVNVKFLLNQMPVVSGAEIQLFDMYGKFLKTVPVTDETTLLDLSNYASGLYLVKVVVDGQVVAIRKAVRR